MTLSAVGYHKMLLDSRDPHTVGRGRLNHPAILPRLRLHGEEGRHLIGTCDLSQVSSFMQELTPRHKGSDVRQTPRDRNAARGGLRLCFLLSPATPRPRPLPFLPPATGRRVPGADSPHHRCSRHSPGRSCRRTRVPPGKCRTHLTSGRPCSGPDRCSGRHLGTWKSCQLSEQSTLPPVHRNFVVQTSAFAKALGSF